MSKYQLMFDPLPGGWKYGFPRALPEEAVMGKGADLWINPAFDIVEYVAGFGFPADDLYKWKVWPQEVHDKCGTPECCGTCETSEGTDNQEVQYYYPGSDPQE